MPWRSTDAGDSFAPLKTPELENSAVIAPASDTTAVIAQGAQDKLLRTTDSGATWASVAVSPVNVSFVGFTDEDTGSALARGDTTTVLWRSHDGGATWATVPMR